jgi:hypothetical protein
VSEDPWIPSNISMKPLVRDPESEVLMVNELIDEELNCWDMDKLGFFLTLMWWR